MDGLTVSDAFDLQKIKRVGSLLYINTLYSLTLADNSTSYLSFVIISSEIHSSYSSTFTTKILHNTTPKEIYVYILYKSNCVYKKKLQDISLN